MLSLNHARHISLAVLMLSMSSIAGCGADAGERGDQGDFEVERAEIGSAESALTVTLPSVFTATLQNASRDGSTNECLMFYGGAQWESPTRYLWGSDNGYCGFESKAALLANKQAVWKVELREGNKFTITHALTNECLIFSGNGQAQTPTRHLWGDGANGDCGWDSEANLLANGQAIWTLTVQENLDPTSCAGVKAQHPCAPDGEYTLKVAGGPASIYCADMDGTPKEYLTLEHTSGMSNYSQYTSGGASPGSTVTTHYEKVRIDPSTLVVDISDQTFATSTGQLYHSGSELVTSMPYAVAMSCDFGASGQANIDLRGTPFSVAPNEFMQGGYIASGTSDYSENHQVVNLAGNGYCGWTNPQPYVYNPFNGAGGFQLNLVYGAY